LVTVVKRIPCLAFIFLTSALFLRADDAVTNLATNAIATNLPVAPVEVISNAVSPVTNPVVVVAAVPATNNFSAVAAPVLIPPATSSHDELILTGMVCVTVLALAVLALAWNLARRRPVAAPVPENQNLPVPAAQFLPLISLTVKETLAHELAAQRRELLSSQQSATAGLAQLARRLEALQAVAERPALPPAAGTHREVPVKIFCECGQKYSFEVRPLDGLMPFPVACPACGKDGTPQANHFLAKLLNSVTQLLPTPDLRPATGAEVMSESPGYFPANGKPAAAPPNRRRVDDFLAEGARRLETGETDGALKCFEAALGLDPGRAEAHVKVGTALDRLGRTGEALQALDRALALNDSLATAYLHKGGIYNRLARYDEAMRCYEQALRKQKKSAA
jgi:Tetratricopeptide repeat